jgi:hypothetical protein
MLIFLKALCNFHLQQAPSLPSMRYLLVILACCIACILQAAGVEGVVRSASGEPLQFVQVGVEGGLKATATNAKGEFKLDLAPGDYILQAYLLGYQPLRQNLRIASGPRQAIELLLTEAASELSGVEVVAEGRDLAKEVMKNAADKRRFFAEKRNTFSAEVRYKSAVELEKHSKDTLFDKGEKRDRVEVKMDRMQAVVATLTRSNTNYSQHIQAQTDFKAQSPIRSVFFDKSFDYGESTVIPEQNTWTNPYVLSSEHGFTEFQLEEAAVVVPAITPNAILSPLAPAASWSYRFDLAGIVYEDGLRVFTIYIRPLIRENALFEGYMRIQDSTFAVLDIDLTLADRAMPFFRSFHWKEKWQEVDANVWLTVSKELKTTVKSGDDFYFGSVDMVFSDHEVNPTVDKKQSKNQIKSFAEDALDKERSYWKSALPFSFSEYELRYLFENDSLQEVYNAPNYIQERDSAYNRVSIWDVTLSGMAFRSSKRNLNFYINPLVIQMVPLGIGGYRHRFGGNINKSFDNDFLLETEGQIDYGFNTSDVKGKVGVGLTYNPKKFIRTFIRAGDNFELINTYASLGSIFSRSNFVREKSLSVAQRMEVVNGLFAELTADYANQQPIPNTFLEGWSNDLFGNLNSPAEFLAYTRVELRLEMNYRFGQEFYYKRNKKIILPNRHPELRLLYRKGIPRMFNSDVNFDYLEIGAKHEYDIPRLGNGNWSVLGGSFITKKDLRLLEHRYFRGSDRFFFSDPLTSFQLVGPTLSTANAFYRANVIHHFNGIVLNKIPLLNRLKWSEVIGMATINIPSQDFYHVEFYAGVEIPFRIRQQLFRFSIMAVTSDSTLDKARYSMKFGINFWDNYRKRWSY